MRAAVWTLGGEMESRWQAAIDEERISALRASRPPGLVQQPSDCADDQHEEKIKRVEAAGAARVCQKLDDPPEREKPGGNHQADPDPANSRERGLGGGFRPGLRLQTPRASGAPMCLCICSCIRTGNPSGRINPATNPG